MNFALTYHAFYCSDRESFVLLRVLPLFDFLRYALLLYQTHVRENAQKISEISDNLAVIH